MKKVTTSLTDLNESKNCRAEATATTSTRAIPKPDWLTIAIAAGASALVAFLLR